MTVKAWGKYQGIYVEREKLAKEKGEQFVLPGDDSSSQEDIQDGESDSEDQVKEPARPRIRSKFLDAGSSITAKESSQLGAFRQPNFESSNGGGSGRFHESYGTPND